MKKATFSLVAILLCYCAFAQQPVHWTYSSKKLSATTYELHLTANIDDGWHIYSQKQPRDAIGAPTTITFKKNPLVLRIGEIMEIGELKKEMVKELSIEQYHYENSVDYVQKVKLKAPVKTTVSGFIQYEVCNAELCQFPPNFQFKINLN